jgi:hypothetical protein
MSGDRAGYPIVDFGAWKKRGVGPNCMEIEENFGLEWHCGLKD